MTIEEQKYLEECRKKLGADQIEVIQMAFQYGLGIKDVRRVAIPKLNAEQMRQTVFAMLEDVDGELVDLCCQGTGNCFWFRLWAYEGRNHVLCDTGSAGEPDEKNEDTID